VSSPDLATIVRTCVAASTATPDDSIGIYYCAAARVALSKLEAEARELEHIVGARERELVRRVQPTQLQIEGRDGGT
jgi:hypothetical protein